MTAARLITIGFSHYCEKARWALDRAGVPYVEEAHVPILHWRSSYGAGGGRTVPVLVTPKDGVLRESTDIVRWADGQGAHLYPTDAGERAEVDRWVARFDAQVGPATRRIVYAVLLDGPPAFVNRLLQSTATPMERRILPLAAPLVRRAIRRGLGVTPQGAARSRERLEEIVTEVEALLLDGRRYLVAERFTAADLTFAALMAPLIQPPELPGERVPEAEAPQDVLSLVESWRGRRVGQWVQALYRDERAQRPSSNSPETRAPGATPAS